MSEQQRLILAIVLSVAVLFGWNVLFPPPQPTTTPENETPGGAQTEQPAITDSAQPNQPGSAISDYQSGSGSIPVPADTPAAGSANYNTTTISTPLYDAVLSEYQARIDSLTLRQFKESQENGSPLKEVVSQQLSSGLFGISFEGAGLPGLDTAVFKTQETLPSQIDLSGGTRTLDFAWQSPDGIIIRKILTFSADSYLINCEIVVQNGSSRAIKDTLAIGVDEYFDEEIAKQARFAFTGPIAYLNDELKEIKPKDIEDKSTYNGSVAWAGYTDRYFVKMVVPKTPVDGLVKLAYEDNIVTSKLAVPMERIDPGKQAAYSFDLYMGPKSLRVLSEYNQFMTKAVNFGWFTFLAKPLLMLMNYIHGVIPNYGVAIILLTIIIKVLFWPLGTKSYKSMNEMKKVQPLMMEIREKYKDDKQRMNQEMMSLYKTYKVNPAGGCLPMLVQMPIFFALYRMLYSAIELRHAPFIGWITDLSAPDRLFDIALPFINPPGIPVLTLVMGASFFLQQKMTPTAGDPTQARMMMLMPLFMTVLFINFSSGLVLYMFVNNLISMGQQYYTQKKFA
ncbi:MAG: membrane protein insertase YidC [Desulfobacteraceae bacterium]|nr:MAG: membrane protein insertase YidC [Desulfobacteraceae bacterium]